MLTRRELLSAIAAAALTTGAHAAERAESALKTIRKRIGGRLGVHVLDSQSGRRFGIDENSRYAMASTFKVAAMLAQLVATLAAGILAEAIGLRATSWLAPVGGLLGAAILWFSPVRHLLVLPPAAEGELLLDPLAIAVAAEMEQPPGA